MAKSEARTSSDASRVLGGDYEVFLSFCGADTRYVFTDFLYHGLVDAGVHVFRDEDELSEGEVISESLLKAINSSKLYIPIFSQTYASRKWCLRELVLILENVSKSEGQKIILPIFLDVEPEDVKLKTLVYNAAFEKHKENFPEEVEAWKRALGEVDEIKGWNVKKEQGQAAIVKSVVKRVSEKLKTKQTFLIEQLVRQDDRIRKLTNLLEENHDDVRIIGIYGMGGIGKTTIAKVVYNQLCSHFENRCSFLEGIRESSIKEEGMVSLQQKLLSNISGSNLVINDGKEGMRRIEAILSNKKVLVVLDDVDKNVSIKKLIGSSKLYRGSRIIITTRDIAILQGEVSDIKVEQYEMKTMEDDDALRLFCRHAFGKDDPLDDYHELSTNIVSHMGGLPLAIEVVGSSLKDTKNKKFWRETLDRLSEAPEKSILDKLRISYDNLDMYQQQIFLDIACFFFNESKTDTIYMWDDCKYYPERGIKVLIERCLINISENDEFRMHDQLIVLGKKIVQEDNQGDFRKQSRLWDPKEALQVIKTKEVKPMVQALQIDGYIKITNEEFERLPELRFLNLSDGTFVGDFTKSHSKLRWISWHPDLRADYLYLNFPDLSAYNTYLNDPIDFNNMCSDDLAVFKLGTNHFMDDSKAWEWIKGAQNLKSLSLTGCHGILTIPNISKCLDLKRLTLKRCSSLKRIESFIGKLQSLVELKIEDCMDLTNLPEEIGALVKLEHLSLLGCEKLSELPGSIGNLTSLTELDLSDTIISKLPDSIGELKSLRILRFSVDPLVDGEKHDWQISSGISTLVNLEELDLSGHNKLKGELPAGIRELSSLKILNLESTGICEIPSAINMLPYLKTLDLRDCHEIKILSELPASLTYLHLESQSLLLVPDLGNCTNLVELQLNLGSQPPSDPNLDPGCNVRWIGSLSRLKKLDLNLQKVSVPREWASLSHLEELTLRWVVLDCEAEDIPLKGLPRLQKLTFDHCERLQQLSIPSELTKLREVHVLWCEGLDQIRVVGLLESLEHLRVYECKYLEIISGLSYLKKLETLRIEMCNVLHDVEGLDKLESLKFLDVKKCEKLTSLINASRTKIPDDCYVTIEKCGDSIKECIRTRLDSYRQNTSNKIEHPFTITFFLGANKNSEEFGRVDAIKTRKENVTRGSVTYEGLKADVKGFGFLVKKMWYKAKDCELLKEIESDDQVKKMVEQACERGFVDLYVEGGFESELSNAECSKAMANKRQMRHGRTGHDGSVDGGKTMSMENRKKDNDIIGEPANQNDILRSSCQRGEGVEHSERSCKATTQVEDQRDLSSDTKLEGKGVLVFEEEDQGDFTNFLEGAEVQGESAGIWAGQSKMIELLRELKEGQESIKGQIQLLRTELYTKVESLQMCIHQQEATIKDAVNKA